jgi:Lar family restriction alleviation protein
MTNDEERAFIRVIEAATAARLALLNKPTPRNYPTSDKPCPFCGHADLRIQTSTAVTYASIACGRCGATGPDVAKAPADFNYGRSAEEQTIIVALEAWNERETK